jgi:hypothetical protein
LSFCAEGQFGGTAWDGKLERYFSKGTHPFVCSWVRGATTIVTKLVRKEKRPGAMLGKKSVGKEQGEQKECQLKGTTLQQESDDVKMTIPSMLNPGKAMLI